MLRVGSIFFGGGCLLFGLSCIIKGERMPNGADFLGLDGFIVSFMLIGLGSPSIFFSLMTLGQFFPKQMSTVISAMNCSFDASVFVFAVFRFLYEHTNISIGSMFIRYMQCPLLCFNIHELHGCSLCNICFLFLLAKVKIRHTCKTRNSRRSRPTN